MRALTLRLRLPLDRFSVEADLQCRQPVTGIFGASGAGKSSLLECIAGLRRPVEGRIALGEEVWFDSAEQVACPSHRRAIGYVPQEGLLFPHLDVRQNLLAGARRAHSTAMERDDLLAKISDFLEITPLLHRRVTALSGGERQRVALGRALCSGPQLLLLDEPLAALDLPMRRRLLPLLRRLREGWTIPMLLVTHDPIEVQALCDEVIVLREGKVIAQGEPRRILTDPEIFPLAQREGFENLLPGVAKPKIAGKHHTRVRLPNGASMIVAGDVGGRPSGGEREVLVGVAATDILLATQEPTGLSARNVLSATVVGIDTLERHAIVTAQLQGEGPKVVVEVTATTPDRLHLRKGASLFLVIKATACRLYGGHAPSSYPGPSDG